MAEMSTVEQVVTTVPTYVPGRQSLWRSVLRTTEGKIGIGLGAFMIGLIVLGAIFGPTTDYNAAMPGAGSSAAHWFGADTLGRDVLSRFLAGGTTVLLIPLIAVTLSLLIGGSLGLFGAYWGGWPDVVIAKAFDVILTLPPLLIVLVIIGGLGASNTVLIITVALVYAPGLGRVVRGSAQSVIVNPYVLSAQARGERDLTIIFREVLPNVSGPTLAEFGLRLTYGILFVATLSFLGLGVQPPSPDWGLMVAENRGLITVAPWATLLPALGITALAVALNLTADALSRVLAGDDLSRLAVI
jgi:peptide/nickel transport system permease protein